MTDYTFRAPVLAYIGLVGDVRLRAAKPGETNTYEPSEVLALLDAVIGAGKPINRGALWLQAIPLEKGVKHYSPTQAASVLEQTPPHLIRLTRSKFGTPQISVRDVEIKAPNKGCEVIARKTAAPIAAGVLPRKA